MLFLGGLRDADEVLAEFDAVGLGVEDILIAASSCDIWAIVISGEAVDIVSRQCSNYRSRSPGLVYGSPWCKLLRYIVCAASSNSVSVDLASKTRQNVGSIKRSIESKVGDKCGCNGVADLAGN